MAGKKVPIIRVIDLETGPDPQGDEPGIVEYGHANVRASEFDMFGLPVRWDEHPTVYGFQSLVRPYAPIPPETSAIHHIVDADVANAPSWHEILPYIGRVEADEVIVALAAHGAAHDRSLIGPDITGDLPWICTYKIALRLWPDFPSHSNQAIRYTLNPPGLSREIAHPAHRAYPDAYVTAFTLITALNLGYSIDTLIEWSNDVAWLPRCKIGDYRNGGKGTPWPQVEASMLHWILKKDFDVDTIAAVKRELDRREMDQREERELAELNSQLRRNGMTEIGRFDSPRYGMHADRKPANDFTETDKGDREHPTNRPVDNLELPL